MAIIRTEVLYVKKNLFSDNNEKKNSKGFYAALGISAVMIGSACVFAYDQGKKLTANPNDKVISIPEAPVDNKATGIPKETTVATTPTSPTTYHTVAAAAPLVTTTFPKVTVPAAGIIAAGERPATVTTTAATTAKPDKKPTNGSVTIGSAKLENPKPPLKKTDKILAPFSGSELVKNETTGSWQTHNGCDIAAEVGAEVYTISSGEIVKIETDPLWGVSVTVNHHNGFVSKYCSLGSDLSVQEGDVVGSGDVIGVVGSSADIESGIASHLHLEVQHNGSFVDPKSLF